MVAVLFAEEPWTAADVLYPNGLSAVTWAVRRDWACESLCLSSLVSSDAKISSRPPNRGRVSSIGNRNVTYKCDMTKKYDRIKEK